MPHIVKRGDRHDISWTVGLPEDITLAGATLKAAARGYRGEPVDLAVTGDGHTITHRLTGTLPAGTWQVEVEITTPDGRIVTAPGDTYETLTVLDDIA